MMLVAIRRALRVRVFFVNYFKPPSITRNRRDGARNVTIMASASILYCPADVSGLAELEVSMSSSKHPFALLDNALQRAIIHHQAGRMPEAEKSVERPKLRLMRTD